MTDSIKVCVAGAGGRMGQALIETIADTDGLQLTAALDIDGSPAVGKTVAEGVAVSPDSAIAEALKNADVLIDFTRPAGTLNHVQACVAAQCAMVIGTTGFDEAGKAAIASAAKRIPIVMSSNMSVGVTLLKRLVVEAARALGPDYDIEILEMHHKHKVDAPSGTALLLGQAAAEGAGVKLDEHAVYERHGVIGERRPGEIGFATLRGGDVVGDHTVMFCGEGERVELTHKASSRRNFASGAMRACGFVVKQKPGMYSMEDVLGMK